MKVRMQHIIIQCTIVLGLSSKDTCLYPNTLFIQSLSKVNFCMFHTRDLTPFLICLSSAYAIFQQIFFYLTQPWCIWNTINSHVIIHKFPRYNFYLLQTCSIILTSNITIFLQLNHHKHKKKINKITIIHIFIKT